MTKQQVFSLFSISDLHDLPGAVMELLQAPIVQRNNIYQQLAALNNFDYSYDWFQQVFEDEMTERKQKKQDFTPPEVAELASQLTGTPQGVVFEPTAGNGSMLIADWWHRCQQLLPWQHFPSQHLVSCWEMSKRSLPILLLNLSIRGIMGYVYHGNVLEQNFEAKYILLNRSDDSFAFSEIIRDETGKRLIAKAP